MFKKQREARLLKRAFIRGMISLLLLILLCYIAVKYNKKVKECNKLKENSETLIKFYKAEIASTVKRYEYTKKDYELLERLQDSGLIHDAIGKNYFPLFLSHPIKEQKLHRLNLEDIDFVTFVKGYNLINKSDTFVEVIDNTSDKVMYSLLESAVLLQLLESIIRNFLQFKRCAKEQGTIKLSFFQSGFTIECNLFKLTRERLIRWSRSIFDNTGNPFILDFDQIFKVLEIFNYRTSIEYKEQSLVLDVKFDLDSAYPVHKPFTDNVIAIQSNYQRSGK